MGEDIFSTVIAAVNQNILEKISSSINRENFQEIGKLSTNKKIAFIDGGNAELLKAVNFSLQFIRTNAVVFQNNKKIDSVINEFFVLVSADEDMQYNTKIFLVKGKAIKPLKFDSLDRSLMDGNERADISKIANVIRRFAEIELAQEVDADVVVLDGSLKCLVTNEKEKMQELYESGKVVSALAKTSKIFLDGKCLLSQLDKEGEWYYKIKDNVYAVKLNNKSKYVFEFNIKEENKVKEVLSLLVNNSHDPVFPGYPYGLILADKIARVSNEEKAYLLTQLKVKAGKNWQKIRKILNVLNSHEILDNIS